MGRALQLPLVMFVAAVSAEAFPLEFTVGGGARIAHDRFTAIRTTFGPGWALTEQISSENHGGYCLETGIAGSGLGRWTPFVQAGWSFDRSALRGGAAPQFLRSRGASLLAGVSRSFNAVFTDVTLSAATGFDWEKVEQQNGYFGGTRFGSDAPVAAAGVSLDSPLFTGLWTTVGYRYVYKRSAWTSWSEDGVDYAFSPRRERHILSLGLIFKP